MASQQPLNSGFQPTQEATSRPDNALARRILVGGFLGAAWGASLRAWMVLLALEVGDSPRFTWSGTFGGVLLPTTLVGALLGAAAHSAETSDRKRWRWVILSPLLLIVGPVIFTKDFFSTLVKTGMGGGAIGVALVGAFGGYRASQDLRDDGHAGFPVFSPYCSPSDQHFQSIFLARKRQLRSAPVSCLACCSSHS